MYSMELGVLGNEFVVKKETVARMIGEIMMRRFIRYTVTIQNRSKNLLLRP